MSITSVRDPMEPHCVEIVSRIYLGDCEAFNKDELTEKKITHVLSLGAFENDLHVNIEYKNINILDVDEQNIIQYFDEAIEYIQEAYKCKGRILIHCQAGVSRSPTILAACLMKSKKINRDEALDIIQRKRASIAPNAGFMEQLSLYYDLNYEVDPKHAEYRRFLVASMAEEQQSYGYVAHVALAADPEYTPLTSASDQKKFKALRCKKCRRMLVGSEHVVDHEAGKGQLSFSYHKRNSDINITTATTSATAESEVNTSLNTVNASLNPLLASLAIHNNTCSSYFIEPMEWQDGLIDEVQGRIDCPKCHSKLGSYNWAGDQCSCGRWITPSFMLHRNKVDEVRNVVRK
ncbi:protein-tyrosine phosphatase-like protein [Mycotypha africana]|uniref:protein-tyrosine phosphatase-like protein n=1 Tax=Mycotypha africana TaxID=64632 RepID=UPI002300DCAB|nr:protein-tyrosine phosphatase-like protein [Mycotypha africana]KAI8968317.1 protein-tyrosine phosphatase-like protein [Mycotypha africana]